MPDYLCLKRQKQHIGEYSIVPLRYEDRFLIMKWRNEQIYHLRQSRPLTEEDQQGYFDNVVSKLYDNPKPDQILFSYLEKGVCIGYGGLVHINWLDRNAEISFIMDTRLESEHFSEHWCNYLTMLKKVAFEDLTLHKIYTYAFDLRPHLYAIFEANGFIREATLREHCFFQGTFKDVIIHALIEEMINRDIIYSVGVYSFKNYIRLETEEKEMVLKWRNNDAIRQMMYNTEIITVDDHLRFIDGLAKRNDKYYWIVYKGETPLGSVNLVQVDQETGSAELGYYIRPDRMGDGEGLFFVFNVLDFVFNVLRFKMIYGATNALNKSATILDEFFGFQRNGEKTIMINGEKTVFYEHTLTSESFNSNKEEKNSIDSLLAFMRKGKTPSNY